MNRRTWPSAFLALLIVCADWLLFDAAWGISLVLFFALLAIATISANRGRAPRRALMIAAGLVVAALPPLIEDAGWLASLLSILALAHLALIASGNDPNGIAKRLRAALGLLFAGPFRCGARFIATCHRKLSSKNVRGMGTVLVVWTVPTVLGTIFLLLFTAANPVLEGWFASIRIADMVAPINPARLAFWLAAAAVVSPFLFPREPNIASPTYPISSTDIPVLPAWAHSDAAVLRSLVVFNLLFALQTALDLRYLWRGAALPSGMSYADYAHRGAYPLLVAALLAGAFVIVAMKPDSARSRSPLMRTLVFAWTAQTVLLVISAMRRLAIYIDTYSLTYLRSAAFIWMFLVAVGLVLIVCRIAFNRSNTWLVTANLIALGLTLYLCSFVNFPAFVATFDVTHSAEFSGTAEALDLYYLSSLGPQALPALDRYIAQGRDQASVYGARVRQQLATIFRDETGDWRAWSFRNWRLARYLKSHP